MKLRVIENGLFVPQYYQKDYYGAKWVGFLNPNIKFKDEQDAIAFIKLVQKSIRANRVNPVSVVYKNFQDPKK